MVLLLMIFYVRNVKPFTGVTAISFQIPAYSNLLKKNLLLLLLLLFLFL